MFEKTAIAIGLLILLAILLNHIVLLILGSMIIVGFMFFQGIWRIIVYGGRNQIRKK